MIAKVYYWAWHDVLKLSAPITDLLIHNITAHPTAWTMTGSVVLSTGWALLIHLVATRNGVVS